MPDQLILAPRTVVGYHGCTQESATSILSTGSFRLSQKEYDWLGEGFYFFEYAPNRAWEWAKAVAKRENGAPAVIEAAIRLGRCVNLLDTAHMDGLPIVFESLQKRYTKEGLAMPRNTSQGAHFLDQEIVNGYCEFAERRTSVTFQTVRGCFPEGLPVYAGSKILRQTHVQIAVRDASCISKARQVQSILFGEQRI